MKTSNSMEEPPNKKTKRDFKSSATNSIGIGSLPREVLCIIFLYLDKKSVRNSTATCNFWFELIRGNSNLSSHVKLYDFDERIQDFKLTGARWPVLKTVQLCGYVAEEISLRSMKLVNTKECPTLEKIIISAPYCLTTKFPQFPHSVSGTITELTFNLKDELRSFQVEHVTSLRLVLDLQLELQEEEIEKRTLANGLKLIGNTANNLKDLYVRFVNSDGLCHYMSECNPPQEEKETVESFQKSFCQMIKRLAKSLKRVQIKVPNLYYIDTLFPHLEELTDLYVLHTYFDNFQRFIACNLEKFSQQFKNLRRFHIDVSMIRVDNSQFDWIKDRLPQVIDEMFQDITRVKIQFNVKRGSNEVTAFTVTKEPNQNTKVSTILRFLGGGLVLWPKSNK